VTIVLAAALGMAVALLVAMTQPPRRIYFAMLISSFVVYLLVALLRSNLPVLIIDALAVVLVLQTFSLRRPGGIVILDGSKLVMMAVLVFFVTVAIGLTSDNIVSGVDAIRGVRTLLFGLVILVLSTVWLDSPRAMDTFLRIVMIASILAALWGIRQLMFGLWPYEIERLAIAGSSLTEWRTMGRLRVPSFFGVPTAFAFVMLTGIMLVPVAVARGTSAWMSSRPRAIAVGLLLTFGLLSSLMRGAFLGLIVGLVTVALLRGGVLAVRLVKTLAAGLLIIATAYGALQLRLEESTNTMVRSLGTNLQSAWSTIPLLPSAQLSSDQQRLASYSVQVRTNYIRQLVDFLNERPLGAGVGTITTSSSRYIVLPTIDIGFLRVGAELGWLGLVAYVGLFASVALAGFRRLRTIRDARLVRCGRWLLGLWVAYSAAMLTNGYFETETLSVIGWSVAGLMLNLRHFEAARQPVVTV
jgi:hypothetical protein